MLSIVVGRAQRMLPFVVSVGVGLYLWSMTSDFDTSMSAGRVGPAVWPKIVLTFLLGAAMLGIVQALLPADPEQSLSSDPIPASGEGEGGLKARPSAMRALTGIGILAMFPIAVPWLGFLTTCALVLFGQMWVGGYRKPMRMLVLAVVGTLALFFVFQRIVYLSLPIGTGPFADLTILVMTLFGVR